MGGPVALVGAGEFLPGMAEIDRELLAATGRARPRVALLPAASWPDGEAVFARWAAMGEEHFRGLGAEVEKVLVGTPQEADDDAAVQAIGEADLVYLSGGSPSHLAAVVGGTRLGAALAELHDRGSVLAGCSAGAMVLAEHVFGFRGRRFWLPWPLRWSVGAGVVPDAAVIPHYDRWPEPLTALMALQAPRSAVVLGIDEDTAMIGRDRTWTVRGAARVTVWHGRRRERFRDGDAFPL